MNRLRDVLLAAEETARQIVKGQTPQQPHKSTFEERKTNLPINGTQILIDVVGAGEVEEVAIVAETVNFSVGYVRDGETQEAKTYTELEAESAYVDAVSTFKDETNNRYVINLKKIGFKSAMRVFVQGSLTLTRTYVKYSLVT